MVEEGFFQEHSDTRLVVATMIPQSRNIRRGLYHDRLANIAMGFAEYTKVVLVGQRDSMPHFMLLFARIGRKKRLRVPRDSCKNSNKWYVGKR